jgi:hypothetical protein
MYETSVQTFFFRRFIQRTEQKGQKGHIVAEGHSTDQAVLLTDGAAKPTIASFITLQLFRRQRILISRNKTKRKPSTLPCDIFTAFAVNEDFSLTFRYPQGDLAGGTLKKTIIMPLFITGFA